MAKSLRSKHRRRMRAVKRIRYGQKELIKLKQTLGLPLDDLKAEAPESEVVEDVVDKVPTSDVTEVNEGDEKEEVMEVDDGKSKRIYNTKTLKDQFGNFPAWINQRKIKAMKKKKKMSVRNKHGKVTKKRVTRKHKK